ncbi:MAG TPA: pyridoxamine 5'-phosphate oxidase family protein [Acidimicrobiales bacterium]|jgi:nitroimidazol reductase NimA-like FMN-containing flavoprotein (pyridoxamine 5'-phosphate oxidase superfamily)
METETDGGSSFSAIELDRAQCLGLLERVSVGRVVLSVNCLPIALPVNVALCGDNVVFSTDMGSKYDAAVEGHVISVEADDIDLIYRTGWSVLMTGVAQLVTDPVEIEWARARLQPWAPGPHRFFVKVPSTLISGRRLVWGALQDAG